MGKPVRDEGSCGCAGGCKHESGCCDAAKPIKPIEGTMASAARKLAASAIVEMEAPVNEADEFIDECKKSGRYVMEVVARVAEKEGIVLSGDAPKDVEKRKIFNILKAVVAKVAEEAIKDMNDDLHQLKDITYGPSCPSYPTHPPYYPGYPGYVMCPYPVEKYPHTERRFPVKVYPVVNPVRTTETNDAGYPIRCSVYAFI